MIDPVDPCPFWLSEPFDVRVCDLEIVQLLQEVILQRMVVLDLLHFQCF